VYLCRMLSYWIKWFCVPSVFCWFIYFSQKNIFWNISYQQRAPSTCSWKAECGVRRTDTSCCTIPIDTTVSVGGQIRKYAWKIVRKRAKRRAHPGHSNVTSKVTDLLWLHSSGSNSWHFCLYSTKNVVLEVARFSPKASPSWNLKWTTQELTNI